MIIKITSFFLFILLFYILKLIYPIFIDFILSIFNLEYKIIKRNVFTLLLSSAYSIVFAGITILIIIFKENDIWFFPLSFFAAFTLASFVNIISSIQSAWDDIVHPTSISIKQRKIIRTLTIIFVVMFFSDIILIILEGSNIENTIGGWALFSYSIIFGLVCSVILFVVIHKKHKFLYRNSEGRVNISFGILICIPLLLSSLSNYVNREFSFGDISYEEFLIKSKYKTSTGAVNYLELVSYSDKFRIEVDDQFYSKAEENCNIILELKKGLFNYHYVNSYSIKH